MCVAGAPSRARKSEVRGRRERQERGTRKGEWSGLWTMQYVWGEVGAWEWDRLTCRVSRPLEAGM